MLVLTRFPGQSIKIGDDIEIKVFCIDRHRGEVRLGIAAPRSVNIRRTELAPEADADSPELFSENSQIPT